jgi:hypothetical protein
MEISNQFQNLPTELCDKIINYVDNIRMNEKRKEVCFSELKQVIRYLQYYKKNPPIWLVNDTDSKHIDWVIKLVSITRRLHET